MSELVLTYDDDASAVWALHSRWWRANVGFDIVAMTACFLPDLEMMNFNLNGHNYFGVEELRTLWEYLNTQDVAFKHVESRLLRYERRDDVAWLASEVIVCLKSLKADAFEHRVLRMSEVFRRAKIDGKSEWRIWHFHCSDHAPGTESRPGFGDTLESRGIGVPPTPFAISLTNYGS